MCCAGCRAAPTNGTSFVTPDELARHLRDNKLAITEQAGVVYSPFADRWSLSSDMDVNYMVVAEGALNHCCRCIASGADPDTTRNPAMTPLRLTTPAAPGTVAGLLSRPPEFSARIPTHASASPRSGEFPNSFPFVAAVGDRPGRAQRDAAAIDRTARHLGLHQHPLPGSAFRSSLVFFAVV